MKVKQLTVFLENKKGRLLEVLDLFKKENINIRALTMADTLEFGLLRLIVSDTQKAKEVLKHSSLSFNETNVISVEVPDRVGGMADVLRLLDKEGISVEYVYAFLEKNKDNAVIVFRIEDIENAIKILSLNNVRVLSNKEISDL